MDPQRHSRLSARRHGGRAQDYYALHSLMDCTKELCSDNRHRLLHNMWGIRRVVLPIVGPVIENEDGRLVPTKTLCELDHVLADFQGQYLPTLADFVAAIEAHPDDERRFREVFRAYRDDVEVRRLLLSPLAITGTLKSLLITHNSWFLGELVPRILGRTPRVRDFEIAPAELFDRMRFELWMDNGVQPPPSARGLCETRPDVAGGRIDDQDLRGA